MTKKEEPQKQPVGYIEMSHICNECSEEDCETACENGTCKLMPRKV